MFDLKEIYDALIAQLRSVYTPMGLDVVEGAMNDGEQDGRVTPGGVLKPFGVVVIGSPDDSFRGGDGITGVRQDMSMIDLSVLCIAESYGDCISLVATTVRAYRGFVPVQGCGEMMCYGSFSAIPQRSLLRPARFAQAVGFGMSIGALVVP